MKQYFNKSSLKFYLPIKLLVQCRESVIDIPNTKSGTKKTN